MFDVGGTRMTLSPAALLGDAASAWALHDALRASNDISEALAEWEPAQLELGRHLLARGHGDAHPLARGLQLGNPDPRGDAYGAASNSAIASRSSRPDSSLSGSRRNTMFLANESLSPLRRGSTWRWMWNTV